MAVELFTVLQKVSNIVENNVFLDRNKIVCNFNNIHFDHFVINILVLSGTAHPNWDELFSAPVGPGMFLQGFCQKKIIDLFYRSTSGGNLLRIY